MDSSASDAEEHQYSGAGGEEISPDNHSKDNIVDQIEEPIEPTTPGTPKKRRFNNKIQYVESMLKDQNYD